jgi:integrase
MSYRVKPRGESYRVIRDWSEAGVRKTHWLNWTEAKALGFRKEWGLDAARQWGRHLTLSDEDKRRTAARLAINKRLEQEAEGLNLRLPQPFWGEFCHVWEGRLTDPGRARKQLAAAGRLLVQVTLPPEAWGDNPQVFYRLCEKQGFSMDWTRRLIKVINEFGARLGKAKNTHFSPIAIPRGRFRDRILNSQKRSTKSAPIRPDQGKTLRPDHYAWLQMTIWFGLRPGEVKPELWEVKELRGHKCLCVEQPKLGGKVKVIPLLFPEQIKALALAETNGVTQPAVKTLKKHLGESFRRYGGRKAFVRLMKDKGRKLNEISAWMGHTDINTTRQEYEEEYDLVIGE